MTMYHHDSSTTSSTTTATNINNNSKSNIKNDYTILLESFDQNQHHEWVEMNDPVMGGQSTGSFHIVDAEEEDGGGKIGVFTGQVRNIPFLHDAPGFIQVRTTIPSSSTSSSTSRSSTYPDISHCHAFELLIRSQYPNYPGYRMSFGTQHAPHGKRHAFGYKTQFTIVAVTAADDNTTDTDTNNSEAFQSIVLPFRNFTDYWDDATGNAIVECNPDSDSDDHVYCPTIASLQDIQTMALWGEGYLGNVNIDIKAIYAIQCSSSNDDDDDDAGDDTITNHQHNGKAGAITTKAEDKPTTSSPEWMSMTSSWLHQLVFGQQQQQQANKSNDEDIGESSSSSSSTTTAQLLQQQRNLLLSTVHRRRW